MTHPHMSITDRAAQFSPFAALTGHDSAIKEAARLTEQRIELDENKKAIINEKLQIISKNLPNQVTVSITYFLADKSKDGGSYITVSGNIKKIDSFTRCIVMDNELKIPINDIFDLNGALFDAESIRQENPLYL